MKVNRLTRVTDEVDLPSTLALLKSHATKATLEGMARYAIPSNHAWGVAMRDIRTLGKSIGRNHKLAKALWNTGVYEARMLVSFVGDPLELTSAEMDRWCKDFDNWAICDTLCFNLFDRSPRAWAKVKQWSRARGEFQKRTAFALLWSLALHDAQSSDEAFLLGLSLIDREAHDERNFVKKAISMALGSIGKRNHALNEAAAKVARRLIAAPDLTMNWIGKDALRGLAKGTMKTRNPRQTREAKVHPGKGKVPGAKKKR